MPIMDYKMLIAPIVAVVTSYLLNMGVDLERQELEAGLNALVTLIAGAVAHYIATKKAKKTP